MRLLILGGTFEARTLVERLADDACFEITVSLAGRTTSPRALPVETRFGGFGGADGLRQWIGEHRIEAVVDATHPYAAQISANVIAAVAGSTIPLASLVRAPWERVDGDNWIDVADAAAAARSLPENAKVVFLTVGRLELSAFVERPEHTYFVRTIDPPGDVALPPRIELLRAQGPFHADDEVALMREKRVEIVVSKNSGGPLTYAKIEAARALRLPVIMIARPHKPAGHVLNSVDDTVRWLEDIRAHHDASISERGV